MKITIKRVHTRKIIRQTWKTVRLSANRYKAIDGGRNIEKTKKTLLYTFPPHLQRSSANASCRDEEIKKLTNRRSLQPRERKGL